MQTNWQALSMDVIIVHAAGVSVRDAHAAARSVPCVRLLSTFVDGWGRTVTMAIATGSK